MWKIFIFMCVLIIPVNSAPQHRERSKEGWDSDGMHPAADNFKNTRLRAATDWGGIAQEELHRAIEKTAQVGVAKNIILMLGDGMGMATLTTARFLNAQRQNIPVHESGLSFETFPDVGISKTYTADRMVADSAGAATAMLCGEKVNFYTVGVNENVLLRNCSNVQENRIKSILIEGINSGKLAGVVTNTRITHASPSAAYAHTAYREFEANVPGLWPHREQCPDIAHQMVHDDENQNIRVFLGGGLRNFYPKGEEIPGHVNSTGERSDMANLIEEWLSLKSESGLPEDSYAFVNSKDDLDQVDTTKVDYLLGLFASSHMSYEMDRQKQNPIKEPSLNDMIEKAIEVLQKGENGYVLFIEAGRIDHAHHDNMPHRALDETLVLSDAVTKVMELTNKDDTLIVVTGDHSHSFAFSGYPDIDSDILGTYVGFWEPDDGMPYTPLSYTDGPGFYIHRTNGSELTYRMNLTDIDTTDVDYVADAGLGVASESHGGEDTPIFARGPMSFIFQGEHQQHYIAHAMMYAACIGPYTESTHCDSASSSQFPVTFHHNLSIIMIISIFTTYLYI